MIVPLKLPHTQIAKICYTSSSNSPFILPALSIKPTKIKTHPRKIIRRSKVSEKQSWSRHCFCRRVNVPSVVCSGESRSLWMVVNYSQRGHFPRCYTSAAALQAPFKPFDDGCQAPTLSINKDFTATASNLDAEQIYSETLRPLKSLFDLQRRRMIKIEAPVWWEHWSVSRNADEGGVTIAFLVLEPCFYRSSDVRRKNKNLLIKDNFRQQRRRPTLKLHWSIFCFNQSDFR